MTANFNVAFAMSGIIFYAMLMLKTNNDVSRQTFCYAYCVIIAIFMVLSHLFYFKNIQISAKDVDENDNVDPYQIREFADKDFKFAELWDLISSTEVLLLALFYSLNSVCVV